jgi:hypothetical protein
MKTMLSSKRNHYMARVSILVVTVALIAGMVGCAPAPTQYNLTISSTSGGSVITPGEGTFTYNEGTVVNLVAAEAEQGYRFVSWTGDVSIIADVNDATTTITMNGDYEITANFEAIATVKYSLATSSTTGGSVAMPGDGTFAYNEGVVVNLVAKSDEGYRFVDWTGNVGNIANVNSASTTITMNGDYSIIANFEQEEAVYFADSNLKAAIRDAIGKPAGPIYPSNLEGLTSLSASNRTISNLTGLEQCTNLTELYLDFNQISDISHLASLTGLISLDLGGNQISDISPLIELTELTSLNLWHNNVSNASVLGNHTGLTSLNLGGDPITDISFLANLTELEWLDIHGHMYQRSDISVLAKLTKLTSLNVGGLYINDISPLAGLTKLTSLSLGPNQIGDISPLANLTNLTYLNLGRNQISDIYSLVQNGGLATGDAIDLSENPLSWTSVTIYIPQLQARGVSVQY